MLHCQYKFNGESLVILLKDTMILFEAWLRLTTDNETFYEKWIAEVQDDDLAKLKARDFKSLFERRILPYHPESNEFRKMIDKLTSVNNLIEVPSSKAVYETTVMPNFR
jgi:hypothetical protein